MAVTAHERVTASTKSMTDAVYAALEAIDAYVDVVGGIAEEQAQLDDPNHKLIKRMRQFSSRAAAMTDAIEDEILDHLNFCNDRLFSVELAERGEFI